MFYSVSFKILGDFCTWCFGNLLRREFI